jgi:hypothetical protein
MSAPVPFYAGNFRGKSVAELKPEPRGNPAGEGDQEATVGWAKSKLISAHQLRVDVRFSYDCKVSRKERLLLPSYHPSSGGSGRG